MASRLEQNLLVLQAAMPGLVYRFGWRELARQDSPPRIVWVPSQNNYGPASTTIKNPAPVMGSFAGVNAHLWGKDYAAVEELEHQLIVAMVQAFGSNFALQTSAGEYITQQAQEAGWIKLGEVYVLPFAIGIPIVQAPWDLAKVTDVTFVGPDAVQGDGLLTSGEQ